MARKIVIDVVSDVICPWCFLGKRRLDKALASLPDVEADIGWRPFMLDATIPLAGMDRRTYLANKFGEERLATLHDPLIAAGREDGVPYAFDRITRTPNTLNAHRLIRWSHVEGKQHEIAERLFMAYWNEGRDVGDVTALAAVATEAGMNGAAIAARLATDEDADKVGQEIGIAHKMGITGVPCFVLAQKYGVMGAQAPAQLAEAIDKAAT
jgi:predicted DsbA family dithiol-disulfide isomerase